MDNCPERAGGFVLTPRMLFSVLVVFLLTFVYAHQVRFDSPTPVSRLDLLHALVVHQTVCIDAYHRNTPDKARFEGRYYSDKAPGVVAVAYPAFAAAAAFLEWLGIQVDSKPGWLISSWIANAASNALFAALGAVAMFAYLCAHVAPRLAFLTTLALFMGAAPLPYATVMFSHALVVGCTAIALWAIHRGQFRAELGKAFVASGCDKPADAEHSIRRREHVILQWARENQWELVAGFACGLAIASEFTSGIVIAGLFVWLILDRWKRAIPFCIAGLLPLLMIPGYSWACFGNPFVLPYSFQASFPQMKHGLYAIRYPDLQVFCKLLFSPTRGLFFWSPFLLMAGVGYYQLMKGNVRLFFLFYTVPLLQIIVISGRVWDWQAGPSLGPRYLAPILPLLALPCALGVQRFAKTGMVLAVLSICLTTLATLTDACPPGLMYNPLLERHIPLLVQGKLSPNLGIVLGLPPYLSLGVFFLLFLGGSVWLCKQMPPLLKPPAKES